MNESDFSRGADLTGRLALVTGASGDIGGAVAIALGARGADLIMLGRSETRLEQMAARAQQVALAGVETYSLDITDDRATSNLARTIAGDGKGLDILVHAAGAYGRGMVEEGSPDELDRQYQVNVRAPYLLTQVLLPLIREKRGGDIVFINSSQAKTGGPGMGAYAATQHGRDGLAESLRADVNEAGVRVLSVFLGRTAGRRQSEIFASEGRPYVPERLLQPADVAEMIAAALCLSRRAEVMSMSLRPAVKSY